jgi:enoyl-CoA hydratase/carnithine racemase
MTAETGTAVESRRDGRILTLTLNNPPENKLNGAIFQGLSAALDLHREDVDLIIFTGKGNVFSKGFDLELMRSCTDQEECRRNLLRTNAVYNRIERLAVPTIAAINGHCFGGGLELALTCHFRLCASKARLGLPEVSNGTLPGLGGVFRLTRLIGRSRALELVALGDLITSEEAFRLGLVSRIFPRENFLESVRQYAAALLSVDQNLIRELIRLTASAPRLSDEENLKETIESFIRFSSWIKK